MEYRYLGNSGLKVSVIGLGGWITYGGQVSQDLCYKCMRTAFDLGINYFDTAEVYANGQSEIDMGATIKRCGWKRSDLVISTKIFWGGSGPNDRGLSRKHIVEGLNASLQRLQLEYVDIVFAHRPDPDTPMEEIVRAFNHVIDQGKAFYWGTSEWSAQQVTEARLIAKELNLIGPCVEQPQYNMFHRERFEKEYKTLFTNYKLGSTIWSPLASGLLSGKYNDGIPENSRLAIKDNVVMSRIRSGLETEEGKAKIKKVVALKAIADRLECTTAQLALAWCLKNPNVSSAITGASKPSQIQENVEALKVIPKLTVDVLHEIEEVLKNRPIDDFNFRYS
ncbi:voltage-dependent potassium channel, beta subunit [Basidiobolus meristosporus CBS 931.73]|uniref:Voltage-dependent potassium channel, beta subunit n=1 Tax=Basidiobolus meristosporus CBS 931.73 TaxID=1314790 RepID=A0A1Y1YX22_9FUNG|nr:voltage-dependent potassium channel, beta subunit [Basidiobolus meristosporus CBS 931.73]|eukprot:ORY02414.1 voltage-dependent potassium channel, beta subunit [Basidiobolus meristosporus CBS 931.73]